MEFRLLIHAALLRRIESTRFMIKAAGDLADRELLEDLAALERLRERGERAKALRMERG